MEISLRTAHEVWVTMEELLRNNVDTVRGPQGAVAHVWNLSWSLGIMSTPFFVAMFKRMHPGKSD